MKNTFSKTVRAAALTVLTVTAFAYSSTFAQNAKEGDGWSQTQGLVSRDRGARALEGSWSVQMTIRNCGTGASIVTFPKMNTFMQGGTVQEFSVGSAPLPRGPAHGVWKYEGQHNFSYALQFFRFNADGTYGTLTRARWHAEMDETGDSYSANATIEVFNSAGILIATACASEVATRFE